MGARFLSARRTLVRAPSLVTGLCTLAPTKHVVDGELNSRIGSSARRRASDIFVLYSINGALLLKVCDDLIESHVVCNQTKSIALRSMVLAGSWALRQTGTKAGMTDTNTDRTGLAGTRAIAASARRLGKRQTIAKGVENLPAS